jgi:hypothetical protein
MGEYDYLVSLQIEQQEYPFYALIMAAMRQADSDNLEKLKTAWPDVWKELYRCYHTPGIIGGPLDRQVTR